MKRPPNDFILGISRGSLGLVRAERLALVDIFSNCDEPLTCGRVRFPHVHKSTRPQLRHSCGAFAVDRHNPVKHAP